MTKKLSFIVPTLNAQKVLPTCLKSIRSQSYPQNKIEIIVADGGSVDNTVKIAKTNRCIVVKNPLKTAEAGKAIALKHAAGDYIALIDSDNILPDKNWLKTMLIPFSQNKKIIGSEPWAFTYRKKAGFIERYSALIGANDPYAFVCGISDRINYIDHKWTHINLEQKLNNNYILVKLESKKRIPTIGANGTIFKSSFLKKQSIDKYLFDIDIIQQYLAQHQYLFFAKVKIGIIHTFCESSINKFIKKQNRRLTDLYTYKNIRNYNWSKLNQLCVPKYVLYTLLIIPSFMDSLIGFIQKPDIAWFFHPIACYISLIVYGFISIRKWLGLLDPISRNKWKQ